MDQLRQKGIMAGLEICKAAIGCELFAFETFDLHFLALVELPTIFSILPSQSCVRYGAEVNILMGILGTRASFGHWSGFMAHFVCN